LPLNDPADKLHEASLARIESVESCSSREEKGVEHGMRPGFSVLIPAYNQPEYVRETIESVLSQTFTDYEVIVVDDGSTDRTPQVLESYGTRIQLIRQSNAGAELARDKAAALARGEYLVMLDHDDLLLPGALAIYDRIIRNCDSPPLIIGAMMQYRAGSSLPSEADAARPVEVLKYPDYASKRVSIGSSNSRIVIRKSVFDQVGGYRRDTPPSFPTDDFNLLLKTTTYGPCMIAQEPYTVAYRRHDQNTIDKQEVIVEGILGLARSERQGRYPGGNKSRWNRYALIGGVASTYSVRYCWRKGKRKLALRLLLGTVPMVLAASCKKFLNYSRKPARAIVLSHTASSG
jgi:glycosyltransferase involved in cell wall biosynthesis